jgi:hypothetical protein
MGSFMQSSIKSIIVWGCVGAVIGASAACSPRRMPALTVTDLMEDRVMLDGVLMKCNQTPSKARTDSDCVNARIAIERLASRNEPAEEAKRAEDFERNREQLRQTQEKQRLAEEAKKPKMDAYHLPLVPVEPPPAASPQSAPANLKPAVVSQSSP